MSRFRSFVLLSVVSGNCLAGFTDDFDAAKQNGPQAVAQVQKAYSQSQSANPDFYIKLANYWFKLSQEVSISTKPAEKSDFVRSRPTTGKEVGSISRQGVIDPKTCRESPITSGRSSKEVSEPNRHCSGARPTAFAKRTVSLKPQK